ncbi:proteinase [Aspergillus coremiiformis]|uniref:Proteinase n=1 Tax=Aspergillus coremiiformis TaxID=138285 RepID=A0A5N6ZKY7_9EURO|nr:proteinase [Aspergillus coremiiformis]
MKKQQSLQVTDRQDAGYFPQFSTEFLWRKTLRSIMLALMVIALPWWWMAPSANADTIDVTETEFTWSKITPSSSLQYQDCFGGFQCARLEVPMDYHRSDGQGRRVAIAITRLPAKVPVTDSRYGGAILINPGGPGGSGISQVLRIGRTLQTIVDAETDPTIVEEETSDRYFDIVGFDPRGVNNTTPGFSCFPSIFAQKNWELQTQAEGMLGSSEGSFLRSWQRSVALNTGCSSRLSTAPGTQEALGEHLNTPPVARDLLEIMERHAEWREKQGQVEQQRHDRLLGCDPQQSIVRRTAWKRGQEKLLYWGRSYGTVLGSTFATMFPDRIHRIVLDAVVDLDVYYGSGRPGGYSGVVDADAVFDRFTFYCDQAAADCPCYVGGGPSAIKKAYLAVESALYNASLPVTATSMRGPELVTWTDLKIAQRVALYQPLHTFPLLAQYVNGLAQGNASAMADAKHRLRSPSCPSLDCEGAGPWSAQCQVPSENELYASTAIFCADADRLARMNQAELKQYWYERKAESSAIGDYWASLALEWPYGGHTSHPLLLVSNTLDPVTPLRSAHKMSQIFPGSVVLQQDSEGHSTAAAPSLCVSRSIRRYFQTGELPAPGTVCAPELRPFISMVGMRDISAGDHHLWNALLEMEQIPMGVLPL